MGFHHQLNVAKTHISELKSELKMKRKLRKKMKTLNKKLSRQLVDQVEKEKMYVFIKILIRKFQRLKEKMEKMKII